MLMGIVTKNSILLVEYALVEVGKGVRRAREALIDACSKRAQPIVMTTVAMGAGMLPIALKIGADADFRAPMAIAVIGGLITSTLLSLFYVPVVFTYVDDVKRWIVKLFGKLGRKSQAQASPRRSRLRSRSTSKRRQSTAALIEAHGHAAGTPRAPFTGSLEAVHMAPSIRSLYIATLVAAVAGSAVAADNKQPAPSQPTPAIKRMNEEAGQHVPARRRPRPPPARNRPHLRHPRPPSSAWVRPVPAAR